MERNAQAIMDALADARTLIVIAQGARSRQLREYLRLVAEYGSNACVFALNGHDHAAYQASVAAYYAFKVAPGLKG